MDEDHKPYNFGALPMPDGYMVAWFACHEHYQGVGPEDWESSITVDPYQARRWCIARAAKLASMETPS